ncbi:MAG: hypothetical protein NVS1B2_26650 [Vulcanimicrobiaceae bacterium]
MFVPTPRQSCRSFALAITVAFALPSIAAAQTPPPPPVLVAPPPAAPAAPPPAAPPPAAPPPAAPAAPPLAPDATGAAPANGAAAVPQLPPAGTIPATLTLNVTGAPAADAVFLDTRIRAELDRTIRPTLRHGASIAYGPIVPWPLFPLASGTRAAVQVTVTVTGDDTSAPASAVTLVVLNGIVTPHVEPKLLFLSDDPEYVLSEGAIYRGDIVPSRPVRLYYYHSDVGLPRDLDVVLTANAPTRVHVIDSAAGPDLDVMSVGHTVSLDYLRYRANNEGVIVNLVPGKPYVVRHALMLQGEVVAGIVDAHVVDGAQATVSVVASPAGGQFATYLAGPRIAFDGHHRHGAFDVSNFGRMALKYSVGEGPVAVRYGGRTPTAPNVDPLDDGRNFGDYGVSHQLDVTFSNATDVAQTAYVYERPVGGPVRSTFVVDGEIKEIGCVRLPQPYGVTTYTLPPHFKGSATFETMTDGGSFYPIEFGITSETPTAQTPAVGAPDGCSPVTPIVSTR